MCLTTFIYVFAIVKAFRISTGKQTQSINSVQTNRVHLIQNIFLRHSTTAENHKSAGLI